MKKQRCNRPHYAVQMRERRGDDWHDVTLPLHVEEAFKVRRKLIDALGLPDHTNAGLKATVRVAGVGMKGDGIGNSASRNQVVAMRKTKTRETRLRTMRRRRERLKKLLAAKVAART